MPREKDEEMLMVDREKVELLNTCVALLPKEISTQFDENRIHDVLWELQSMIVLIGGRAITSCCELIQVSRLHPRALKELADATSKSTTVGRSWRIRSS